MGTIYEQVKERMIRYAKIDTQSLPFSGTWPTTPGQRDLGEELYRELSAFGAKDVYFDVEHCVVYAKIPGNADAEPVGFVAHLDTAPDAPGRGVKPWVLENYDGGDILLNKERGIVMRAKEYPNLAQYRGQDLILTDGKPLIWIAKRQGMRIREKVSGSDLFPRLCELAAQKNYRVFLLGAAEGVADRAADRLREKIPGLQISGTFSPPMGFEKKEDEIEGIIRRINDAGTDILAVALGSPKGEKLIYRIRERIQAPLSISIGATLDFIAGNVKRAPRWMSDRGLEWLFRITQDPRRMIRRYGNDAVSIVPIIRKYGKK